MLCFHKLHRYIIHRYTRKAVYLTKLNNRLLGRYRNFEDLFYYTEKYHITINADRLKINIKVYDKKYLAIIYDAIYENAQYHFISWSTEYYPLAKSHPIYKMFNINSIVISYGHDLPTSEFYFSMSTGLSHDFYMSIQYDLNYNIKNGIILINGSYIQYEYADNRLANFKINYAEYIRI